MNSKYVLNTGSATLHIVGYCHFTKHEKPEWKYFQTEEEAYNYAGRNIKPCKLCAQKKEEILRIN